MSLCCKHKHFYQVQGQLAICEKEYCDFICWTPQGIHVERILPDRAHFAEIKLFLEAFFIKVILPILLTGKRHRDNIVEATTRKSQETSRYCWCEGEEAGQMVACDNSNCKCNDR